uniref:Uncharacterized protein n=1 Tax=viral metagenome TaxID=1070528 RepID=A0A6C0KHX9_9ZZZZ
MSGLDAFLDCAAFILSCVDCMKTTDSSDYKKLDNFSNDKVVKSDG